MLKAFEAMKNKFIGLQKVKQIITDDKFKTEFENLTEKLQEFRDEIFKLNVLDNQVF